MSNTTNHKPSRDCRKDKRKHSPEQEIEETTLQEKKSLPPPTKTKPGCKADIIGCRCNSGNGGRS